jgi:glycine cleavage system H protein
MSSIPKELKYTKEHEWIRKTSNPKVVTVGITDFAQSSLGDVTFVDLPAVGRTLKKHEVFGTVESVKSVSELYSPVAGKILKINSELVNTPELVNQDPYSKAWMIEIEMSSETDLNSLLTAEGYEQFAQ